MLIIGTCAVASSWFWGLNNLSLFDWDELNFAETAREMLESGNFLLPTINYLPFHEKPPLFAWMQVLSMSLWGQNPLGARFPNVVCGVLTLLVLWRVGRRLHGDAFGVWWAALLGLSVLPQLYFRSGIIDPWFNLFILLGLFPCLAGERLNAKSILISGAWLGLAVLTKGPAAGLIGGLCWLGLLVLTPQERLGRALKYALIGLLALAPAALWFAALWWQDQGSLVLDFLAYQWRLFSKEDAGHGGFPGYHVVVLLLGCFPAGVFALPALLNRRDYATPADRGMRLLFWTVLILFSIVNTKIVHYSSLCYFPLAWFAARWVGSAAPGSVRPVQIAATAIWGLYALLSLSLPAAGRTVTAWIPRIHDAELLSRLQLPVEWPLYTFLPGLLLLGGLAVLWRLRRAPLPRLLLAHLLLSFAFVSVALPCFAPRLQAYSQGETVAFFQGLEGKEVYLGTAYYKSYAHWFYAKITPERYAAGCQDRQCQFHGPTTLPLYFASPLRKTEQVLREVPDAQQLYSRGGFTFYLRPPAAGAQE